MNIDINGIYLPSEELVAREIDEELIIIPVALDVVDFEDAIYTFNSTGREIWSRLGEGVKLIEIINDLTREYDASPDEIEQDIKGLMEELLKKKIVIKIDSK